MAKENKDKKISEAIEVLKELNKLIDARIIELHEVQGAQQGRHAYLYYRSYIYDAIKLLHEATT